MDYDQTVRTSGKNLVKLAIPLIGTHLANVALGITDTIMMGWYSVHALAALVLGNAYFFVFFYLALDFLLQSNPSLHLHQVLESLFSRDDICGWACGYL